MYGVIRKFFRVKTKRKSGGRKKSVNFRKNTMIVTILRYPMVYKPYMTKFLAKLHLTVGEWSPLHIFIICVSILTYM